MDGVLESDTEGPPVRTTSGQAPVPEVNPPNADPLITPELKNAIRELAIVEAKRIFRRKAVLSVQKTVELSDVFGGLDEASSGFNNASYYFAKGVLRE